AAGLEVERLGVAPVSSAGLRTALESVEEAERVEASKSGKATVESPLSEEIRNPKFEIRNSSASVFNSELPDASASGVIRIPRSSNRTALPALTALAAEYRLAGRRVVFTNGCSDLLHIGHVTCLQEAARLGDVLIVGVNSDAGVGRLKGPGRPIIDERSRAA